MQGSRKPALMAVKDRRDAVVEQLTAWFAEDALSMEEFESRLERATEADSVAALDNIVTDLVVREPAVSAPAAPQSIQKPNETHIATDAVAKRSVVAIMSGAERKGAWRVPTKLRAIAAMGGVELDFRDAVFGRGVTELRVVSILGRVEIIVPPDLTVECDGWAILGGFDGLSQAGESSGPERPTLRITGYALLGGFEIETRLPSESSRDARRRRKREHKELRRQHRRELRAARSAERKGRRNK